MFGLTADEAEKVGAPLISECHASFECRLHDDALVDTYDFFIFEVVKAHVAASPKHPEPCITRATACSWCRARSSAAAPSSGRRFSDRTARMRRHLSLRMPSPALGGDAGGSAGSPACLRVMDVLDAYKARFGDTVTMVGIPSAL